MTMQIHDVSLEVLRTLTLVRHIGADEAPARKRLRKICDITPSSGSSSIEKCFIFSWTKNQILFHRVEYFNIDSGDSLHNELCDTIAFIDFKS